MDERIITLERELSNNPGDKELQTRLKRACQRGHALPNMDLARQWLREGSVNAEYAGVLLQGYERLAYLRVEWERIQHDGYRKEQIPRIDLGSETFEGTPWERVPTPQEYFSLLLDYLDSSVRQPMPDEQINLVENIIHGGREFTNALYLVEPGKLIIMEPGFREREFITTSEPMELSLNTHQDQDHGIVPYFTGREISEMPQAILDMRPRVTMDFPEKTGPLVFGLRANHNLMNGTWLTGHHMAAARGVRERQWMNE